MKKIIAVFAIALLLPVSALPSHGGGGGGAHGGGGGGFSGGGHNGGGGWGGGRGGNFGGARGNFSFHSNNRGFGGNPYNGGNWGNRYYRQGNGGYWSGQNHSFNRAYGNHSGFHQNNNRYNYNGNRSTGIHHFNDSVHSSAFSNNRGFSSGRLNGSSVLPGSMRHSAARMPSRGANGQHLSASTLSPHQMNSSFVRNQMNSISGNRNFRSQVNGFNRLAQNNPGRYYWHNYGGWNYCNYCDRFGCNWYGWYGGGSCFWTQYYGGLFWWNDPWYGCWDYWDNGCWNWPNPATNTVYIYENGQYVPSNGDAGNNDNLPPDNGNGPQAYNGNGPSDGQYAGQGGNSFSSSAAGRLEPSNGFQESPDHQNQADMEKAIVFQSDDSRYTVKLAGESGDAFLVDGEKKPAKPIFLDTEVQGVRFTGSGRALKIQLTLRDGSLETFKADGKPLKVMPKG